MTAKKGIPLLIFLTAAMLVSTIVRFFQYVTIFDFETGFYLQGSDAAAALLSALLVAEVIGMGVLCIVGIKKSWTVFTVSSDGFGEKTSLYLGIAYLLAAAVQIWETLTDASGAMLWVSGAQSLVYAVTGFLMMKNSVIPTMTGYIQILPSLCFFFRTLDCFNSDLIIASHSDRLLTLVSYIFGAMFLSFSAMCYSRLETKSSRFKELTAAGLSFLFSGVHIFSDLLALITGTSAGDPTFGPDKSVIGLFIISAGFICALCLTEQNKSIEYIVIDDDKKNKKDGDEEESE